MTGAQYKAFLNSDWGPDAYWEEAEITINGNPIPEDGINDDAIKDSDTMVITGGAICQDQVKHPHTWINAEPFARKWLKSLSTVTLMVDVPREHADDYAARIGALGRDGIRAKVVGRVG
jgi:hypothetical protein